MKRLVLIFYCLTSTFCFTSDQANIFNTAVAKCEQGQLDDAIELFSKLPPGVANYFNLASCFYCQNQLMKSLLYLKRAEKLASPLDRFRLLKSINIIKTGLGQPLPAAKTWRQQISYTWNLFKHLAKGINLLIIEILLLILWCIFLLLLKFSNSIVYKFSSLGLIILIFGSYSWLLKHQTMCQALVTSDNEILYSGPNIEYLALDKVPRTSTVIIASPEIIEGFCKVSYDSKLGWINSACLEKI